MSGKPIDEAVARLEALQEQWCASTAGKACARRIATFDAARGAQGEDDFDNEVSATRRCASDLALAIERIRALTAAQQPDHIVDATKMVAQQQGQAVAWVRYRSDGGIEGPVLDQHMDDIRRNSGAWTPLGRITATPPSVPEDACESRADDCGPVMRYDDDGIGLCERCARDLGAAP